MFLPGRRGFKSKPLRRQSESQQFRNLSSVLVGLCHFVDAVHTLTHPRSTPVLCFTGITTVRQVKWLLAIFTGPFRYSVSPGVVRLVRYPFHTPGSQRSYIRSYERWNFVRNKRTILAHIFPPCFIYHRLQNYNPGFLYPKQKGHSGLIGRARYVPRHTLHWYVIQSQLIASPPNELDGKSCNIGFPFLSKLRGDRGVHALVCNRNSFNILH